MSQEGRQEVGWLVSGWMGAFSEDGTREKVKLFNIVNKNQKPNSNTIFIICFFPSFPMPNDSGIAVGRP